ncbi:MAG: exodeoxyribonuclease VII small subunit [Alphaproteobacteria bacterium]|jgi:exodeoxyribonuclease VII small subunit|nr:exodeoxyribonuclease VII small subunit [Alphaproteobacteria bacterium]
MEPSTLLPDVTSLSFEEALKELEAVVRRLEEGRLPLEEAIGSYERGALLKERCEALLAQARLKVDAIVQSAEGASTLETFHHDDE